MSITYPQYLFHGGRIFESLEEAIRYVRTRNIEAKSRQMTPSDAILASEWLIGKLGWPHDRPVEFALPEYPLHPFRIDNDGRKE